MASFIAAVKLVVCVQYSHYWLQLAVSVYRTVSVYVQYSHYWLQLAVSV